MYRSQRNYNMGVVWIAKPISSEDGRGEGETVTENLRRLVKRRGVSNKRFQCILPPTCTACFSCSLTTRCIVWGRIRQNAINLALELPGKGNVHIRVSKHETWRNAPTKRGGSPNTCRIHRRLAVIAWEII